MTRPDCDARPRTTARYIAPMADFVRFGVVLAASVALCTGCMDRDTPQKVAQAFQTLVRTLLRKSETELAVWRDALRDALGQNGALMVDLVPELRLIIGEQPAVPELPAQQAHSRFQMVVRRFVNVFAGEEDIRFQKNLDTPVKAGDEISIIPAIAGGK